MELAYQVTQAWGSEFSSPEPSGNTYSFNTGEADTWRLQGSLASQFYQVHALLSERHCLRK